ncbi:MAG: TlpA family protein disulfide reductase [Nocardioidaceae bacterium]
MRTRPAAAAGAAALLALAAGCGDASIDSAATYTFDPGSASVDVDTPELREAKAAAGIAPCPVSDLDAAAVDRGVPALVLPCLGGGEAVNLAGLGTPAVLNLWAQYCGPCRSEAPRFQDFYEAARGKVAVIGVDWQEPQPGRAIAFADELGLTYPQLADPEAATRAPLRINALPVTVFVDSTGTIDFIHHGEVESTQDLAELVDEHLGVRVAL